MDLIDCFLSGYRNSYIPLFKYNKTKLKIVNELGNVEICSMKAPQLWLFLFFLSGWQQDVFSKMINYTITISDPSTHYADVEMAFTADKTSVSHIAIPVWTPGSYMVREFSKNIQEFQVLESSGKSVAFTKNSKNQWNFESKKGITYRVQYRIYCYEFSVRTSFINDQQALLNLTSVLPYFNYDKMVRMGTLKVIFPERNYSRKIISSLPFLGIKEHAINTKISNPQTPKALFENPSPESTSFNKKSNPSQGLRVEQTVDESINANKTSNNLSDKLLEANFEFSSMDELYDSPIQIGDFEVFEFDVKGVPHRVAMVGLHNANLERLRVDMERVCNTMADIIGEFPKENRLYPSYLNAVPSNTKLVQPYVFIVQNVESGGGGIEHLNSTVVMNQRFAYQNEGSYENFLGLIAHEYFHLWNVKRIRPSELGPFNYNEENYTHSLWIAEGITSYYDELGMMRAGFKSRTEFLNGLAANISNHENRPGARIATLHDMSFDAWIKEYRPNENSKNSTYSYYSKGLIIAALLDAKICKATNGEKSLDDVFKILWNDFYKDKSSTIIGKGYTDEDFRIICEKVAGIDFKSDFDLWLNSTKIPDYTGIFNELGLQTQEKTVKKQEWGMTTAKTDGAVIVKYVNSTGFAQNLGINVNDEVIGLNGIRVNQTVESTWQSIQSPKQVNLIINRAGLLFELTGEFQPISEYQIKLNPTAEMNNSEFWKLKGALQTWLKSNQ